MLTSRIVFHYLFVCRNGAVLHAEDDQPKIAQSCLQSREQDQEQQQLQQQQQQQQQEHPELDADLLALHKQV